MQNLTTMGDVTGLILFNLALIGAVVGGFVWIVTYVNGKVKDLAAIIAQLRAELMEAAERRTQERDRHNDSLWSAVKQIEHGYVRRDDLDGHLGRIDRNVEGLKAEMQKNTEAVQRLVTAVLARNQPLSPAE